MKFHGAIIVRNAVQFALLLAVASSCQKNIQEPGKLLTSRDEIFSTRPQNETHFIALIKLKNPALLTSAKKVNGVTKVDRDLADLISREQESFIDDLKNISGDIKVLYRYRMVLNAVTIVAPNQYFDTIRLSPKVVSMEPSGKFSMPMSVDSVQDPKDLKDFNSVKFIGAETLHQQGIRGQGMKIGIIDTGIDYTHSMLGGAGTPEAYASVDPSKANPAFPSAKVVGGTDFVGTTYNAASEIFENRIPTPDSNPLDEAGHGSHVSGTVAGVGDGDKTYDGVAPDASLYALKVFGKTGSTSDEVVIAALEYAANPAGNLDLSDQLDVVNMSLGSEYGTPHIMYAEAIQNLSRAGTVVVASAGNSGAQQFIVGAPSVAEDAISVAASIDNAEHNWQFDAVKFSYADGTDQLAEAIEGTMTTPIAAAGDVKGSLVYVGLAAEEFSSDVAAQVKGKVALIDRGQVTFAEKLRRADSAGAIGVVMVNSQEGAPIAMGGDGAKVTIPGIMVTKELGNKLKAQIKQGQDVQIQFQTSEKIEKPELIDNLTDFSSQGPRSVDALLKPEISAPGQNVISIQMGGGTKGVAMSGTSMAAPHITGVMALIKQTHKDLSSQELKSLLMGTALTIKDSNKVVYPVSREGAGRVQVDKAVAANIVSIPEGISLGEVEIAGRKRLSANLKLRTLDSSSQNLTVVFEGHQALTLEQSSVSIAGGDFFDTNLTFVIDGTKVKSEFEEVSGIIKFKNGETEVFRIPVLALARQISAVSADRLEVASGSALDAADSVAHLYMKNDSPMAGIAIPFNLLGQDNRKSDPLVDIAYSRECDLQAAGYRILGDRLQFAVKIFNGLTTWNTCELNVQFDNDGDGIADQELVGVPMERLDGLTGTDFKSMLLDAGRARQIRKEFEATLAHDGETDGEGNPRKVDYTDAVITSSSMSLYGGATVAIVEVPLSEIKLNSQRLVGIKIATTSIEDYAIEADDFLGDQDKAWGKLDLSPEAQGYSNLPEQIQLSGNSTKDVTFKVGQGTYELMLLSPYNKGSGSLLEVDQQMLIVKPTYVSP